MHRFYFPLLDASEKTLELTDPALVHQLNKVLRFKVREEFFLFNAHQQEARVVVEDIGKKKVRVKVAEVVKNHTEPRLKVTLIQAIPKKPALFELIVQKATEIGVHTIIPLITERTEGRRLPRPERLRAIATEATEQSRRLHLPTISQPITFEQALEYGPKVYMAYEYEEARFLLDHPPTPIHDIFLLIGPEGGFSQKEVHAAREAKLNLFTFGPRILRMETAAISALSLLLLAYPDR